jgi:uncharacterized membrane protein
VRLALGAVVVPLALATVAGLLLLWPASDVAVTPPGFSTERAHGTVLELHPCRDEIVTGDRGRCRSATVRLTSGPGAPGRAETLLPFQEDAPAIRVGDELVLTYLAEAPAGQRYSFQDFDRTDPLLTLLVLFMVSVLALSRWRGLGSLSSLGASLALLVLFTLPAIMQGGPALPIAVVSAAAIMLVSLYLSHGFDVRTSVALVGTLMSLVLIGGLGSIFTRLGRFTGMMDEGSQYIAAISDNVDLSGLLLAGLVIGALGVLDDVTVTQTWAVWELADADPAATRRSLFARAMRIGRSHVASTVNTLVLAYVGATLPLLLVFSALDEPFGSAVSQEVVAQEVVRGLVGGLGIVAAVPITTAIAALVAGTLLEGTGRRRAARRAPVGRRQAP